MNNKSIFIDEVSKIVQEYPGLTFEVRHDTPVIFGEIKIYHNETLIDSYDIEIHYREGYPYLFPQVFEIGGKIPKNTDWHIFVPTGNCCLKASPEEILICKNGITLDDFISKQVIPYFSHQTFRRENGYFLQERSHGIKGWIEFFQEIVKTKNILNIIHTLNFIQKRREPNRVSNCFCGSGKKYRNCHKDTFQTLSKFSNNELADFISDLKKSNEYTQTLKYLNRYGLT